MALLPVLPALRRSFSSLTAGLSRRRNGSSLRRHAAAAEGKTAHLLFAANLEEPSAPAVPVTGDFAARLSFTRPRYDSTRWRVPFELPVPWSASVNRRSP